MSATGWALDDKLKLSGGTLTGNLNLQGAPYPLTIPAGAASGYVWTTDAFGNGSWQASSASLPLANLGDTLYGGTGGAPTKLAGNTTAIRKFLRELGTGSVSAAPAWDTIQAGDLPAIPAAITGLAPSGDTSGAADTANIQGLLTLAGHALLQPGLFWTGQSLLMSSNSALTGHGQGITTIRACSGYAATQVGSGGNANPGMIMIGTVGNGLSLIHI